MNIDDEPTLRDLRNMASASVSLTISLELLVAKTYDRFVELIEQGLDHVAQTLARNPELKQEHSEDELTIEVVSALCYMGFHARHETKVGGHCDIVVEGRSNFVWLGEAKIFRGGYDWILKGFQQLNTRYSTGSPGQDVGGLVIYIFEERLDAIMKTWASRLVENIPGISTEPCAQNALAMNSKHVHDRTGREFRVRHLPVSLFWRPQDK